MASRGPPMNFSGFQEACSQSPQCLALIYLLSLPALTLSLLEINSS